MKSSSGSTRMTWRTRGLIITIGLLAVMFLFPISAQASVLHHTNAVPSNQVINNDVFLTGQNPILNGTVNGDVFIVGSEVNINGEVNGSVFIVAQRINLPGKIKGNVYAAAIELIQPAESEIGRSLYAMTLSLIMEPESSVGRDLKTVTLSARLNGQTERDTSAIIGPWEIFKILRGFVNQNITGFVPMQPSLVNSNLNNHSLRESSSQRARMQATTEGISSETVDWLLTALYSFLNFLIVGGLMLLVFPHQLEGWAEKVKEKPLPATGYGALVLINGYLLPGLILFLLIGLLLGMIYISLPSLAWIVFWGGLGILVTLFVLFQAAITFLSKVIVAYMVGSLILSKAAPKTMKFRILPLLLGLLIYVPLAAIPYFGIVIGLIVTLLGLGAIWLSRKRVPQQEETVVETATA